jgi:hypothetical protein
MNKSFSSGRCKRQRQGRPAKSNDRSRLRRADDPAGVPDDLPHELPGVRATRLDLPQLGLPLARQLRALQGRVPDQRDLLDDVAGLGVLVGTGDQPGPVSLGPARPQPLAVALRGPGDDLVGRLQDRPGAGASTSGSAAATRRTGVSRNCSSSSSWTSAGG